MSTFPELEAALEAAAHRHYGRRRRRLTWRPIVPAFAAVVAAAAVLIGWPGGAERPAPQPEPAAVPQHALVRSHALALAPDPERGTRTSVAHGELPAVAAQIKRKIPYPPGYADRFDWAATPPGPYDMASINSREEVQMLLEFRAGCLWLRYWLSAHPAGRAAAATVLADVPKWPYQRLAGGSRWPAIAESAARGDAARLAEIERGDCTGV